MRVDIHLRRGGDGVLSGGEEEELPAVFLLPFLNPRGDVLPGVFPRGVFHPVREDREALDLLLFAEEVIEAGDGGFGVRIHRPRHVEEVGDFGVWWRGGFRVHTIISHRGWDSDGVIRGRYWALTF